MVNTSGINPTGHMVLVKIDEAAERTRGGVIMPEAVRDRDTQAANMGVLVAVAPAAFDHVDWPEGNGAPVVGARVLIHKFAGVIVKGNDGAQYRVCEDKNILALMEG